MRASEFIIESEVDEAITDSHRKKIDNVMKQAGYRHLGSGVDAHVWTKDTGSVIKLLIPTSDDLSTAERTFLDFYNFVQKNQGNQFLPKFIKIQGTAFERFEIDGEPFLQISLEKLDPLPKQTPIEGIIWLMSDDAADGRPWSETFNLMRKARHPKWKWFDGYDVIYHDVAEMMGMSGAKEYYGQLYKTMQQLVQLGKKRGYGWDLHTENVMQRNDGTPVITDPWYDDM